MDFQQFVARIPSPSWCYGVASLGVLEFSLAAVHSVYVISSQHPGLACLPRTLAWGSVVLHVPPCGTSWFFSGFREEFESVVRVPSQGSWVVPRGCAPCCCWLELCITLPGLGRPDDLRGVSPFHSGHCAASHFLTFCIITTGRKSREKCIHYMELLTGVVQHSQYGLYAALRALCLTLCTPIARVSPNAMQLFAIQYWGHAVSTYSWVRRNGVRGPKGTQRITQSS
jgi:hypothetical protein